MKTMSLVVRLAHKRLPVLRAQRERLVTDYEREARDYAYGGYRPHWCIHGTNMWTDYDPMCWGCEEYGYNGLPPVIQVAVAQARADAREYERRREVATTLLCDKAMTPELKDRILDWMLDPIN